MQPRTSTRRILNIFLHREVKIRYKKKSQTTSQLIGKALKQAEDSTKKGILYSDIKMIKNIFESCDTF
jgi:hypothetical protein